MIIQSARLGTGFVVATFLTACGGGGTSTAVPADPVIAPIALNLDDPYKLVLTGTGNGIWSFENGGGGGDGDGGGDGGGGAGDGEFVKVKMKFPTLTKPDGSLTWTVLRSQFGITNSTGTLTISKDTGGLGGYKVTAVNGAASAVRPTQGNFFVSTSGQLSGSFPLPTGAGGTVKDSLFSGVRFNDGVSAATDLSEYAGIYTWAAMGADVGTAANFDITKGYLKLNADGTGRSCNEVASWSATCTNGLDLQAKFDDPSNRNLVRIVAAKTQSTPIGTGGATGIDLVAVLRKLATGGVAMSADSIVVRNAAVSRTVSMFASRNGVGPSDPLTLVGAWNYTNRTVSPAFGQEGTGQFAIANVGGLVKARGGLSATNCIPVSSTISAGPANGTMTVQNPGEIDSYLIQLDVDYGVIVRSGQEIGFVRRYSNDPKKAPCQPS